MPEEPPPVTNVPQDTRPLALVYSGPGACAGCPAALAEVLEQAGLRTQYVGPAELKHDEVFDGVALYAQPGGDDTLQVYGALGPVEFPRFAARMRAFVEHGGRYLGVCLGGFLASQWIDGAATIPALRLIVGDAEYFTATPGPYRSDQIIPITWLAPTPRQRSVYFQEGPFFTGPGTPYATYVDGSTAAMIAPLGKGQVGLSGFHFEADASWYANYGLDDPDGPDADLAVAFIDALMKKNR